MEEPAFRYYLLLLGQHLHDVSHRWQTIAQEMAAVGHPYTPERLRRTMFYAIDYTKRKIRRYE
jgi:hypothetical protein